MNAGQQVLVTGGTGELGRAVVTRLLAEGRMVRVLSRRTGSDLVAGATAARGDLATGAGLNAALADVDTVIHCASDPRRPAASDVAGTRQLVAAAAQAGVRHLVYISIVGIESVPLAYYKAKLEAENIVRRGGVPWTILRATQFHSLLVRALGVQRRLPVLFVPRGWRFQPVDAGDVAGRLVTLALGEPAGRVADMGGPEVCLANDLARGYQAIAPRGALVIPVPLPGRASRAIRAGAFLAPGLADGTLTWEGYLQAHRGGAPIMAIRPAGVHRAPEGDGHVHDR